MLKEEFNAKTVSFLTGFHLHRPDHDFKSIKGELYNFIGETLDKDLNVIPIDENLEILKSIDDKAFELKFEKQSLIYQESGLDFEKFKGNSIRILEKWQSLSKATKNFKIAGVLRNILLTNEAPKGVYHSRLYDNYLTNIGILDKKKVISIHLNYSYERRGLDYNINVNLDEINKKDYSFELRLDVNKLDFDRQGNLTFDKVVETFNFADRYYNEEFFKDINLSIKI